MPVSIFVSIFNISMFLWGAWILGRQFAVSTILSTLFYPMALGIMEYTGFQGLCWRSGWWQCSTAVS